VLSRDIKGEATPKRANWGNLHGRFGGQKDENCDFCWQKELPKTVEKGSKRRIFTQFLEAGFA